MPAEREFNPEALKDAMEKKGMGAKELALAVGLTPASIYKYLYGENTPFFANLMKICEVLGIENVNDLLKPAKAKT